MNPSVIQDELLGELRWNDLGDWYESRVQIPGGREIRLSIKVGSDGPVAAVEQARRDFPSVIANDPIYRKQTAAALLDTHNDHWNDGVEIDAEQFASRMTLDSVVFYIIYTELWYHDGDLFWGHSILTNLDSDLRFTNATFEG